ncbi:Sterol binding protein [Saccharomyces pastorianus]|uniref:Sterol binding protein n=1 Tax=Saccharomyces pastorianus TaxID=27292 RepID=A0A6C1ECJ3_SACPS|nr:Sterol binding protein [Saccharomyces pastorianus]
MKFSKVSLLAASASVALSVPVAVTVTQHVHEAATVMVQGIVYVENGHTLTSLVTEGVPTAPGAPATATATAPIVVANAQVDNVAPSATQEGTPVVESSVSTQIQVFTTVSTIKSVQATQQAAQDDVTSSSSSTPSTPSTTSATPSTTSATPSSTSTQSTASAAQSSSGSDFATSMVNEHNTKRALHKDTGSLTWSDTLATYAQNYADSYDCSGNLVHSGGAYGENLALGYGTTASVDAWYNEISSYDYSNPGFTEDAGHFTQVVWKGTSQVGCGLKSCGGQWGDYVICSYQNPGNYIGEFAENVMPLA